MLEALSVMTEDLKDALVQVDLNVNSLKQRYADIQVLREELRAVMQENQEKIA